MTARGAESNPAGVPPAGGRILEARRTSRVILRERSDGRIFSFQDPSPQAQDDNAPVFCNHRLPLWGAQHPGDSSPPPGGGFFHPPHREKGDYFIVLYYHILCKTLCLLCFKLSYSVAVILRAARAWRQIRQAKSDKDRAGTGQKMRKSGRGGGFGAIWR